MKIKTVLQQAFTILDPRKTIPNLDKSAKLIKRNYWISNKDDREYATDNIQRQNRHLSEASRLIDHLLWPANTFNVIAYLLENNDSYLSLISDLNGHYWKKADKDNAVNIGLMWREFLLGSDTVVPDELFELLYSVFNHQNVHKNDDAFKSDQKLQLNLIKLLIASDECFNGLDMLKTSLLGQRFDTRESRYWMDLLGQELWRSDFSTLSTCKSIGSVHFKSTTSQAGISFNSLSQKLAFIKPEVTCKCLFGSDDKDNDIYNILILPWPLTIDKSFFKEDRNPKLEMNNDDFGFFKYENKNKITAELIIKAISTAEKETIYPDVVVIPECSVNRRYIDEIKDEIYEYYTEGNRPIIIVGTYKDSSENGAEESFGENSLEFIYTGIDNSGSSATQSKHHRWALDRAQIMNYHLGLNLTPMKKWWENCGINSREVITHHDNDIQICPLICEDLARQDPVAPVIRALGPNLVIALLLDGPQIETRWPGKYASVLADDPGSSVLSISPYGMTQRSTGTGYPPSSNVALWSDGDITKSLELKGNSFGISLSLEKRKVTQWSADGRKGEKTTLKYAGHTCIGNRDDLIFERV